MSMKLSEFCHNLFQNVQVTKDFKLHYLTKISVSWLWEMNVLLLVMLFFNIKGKLKDKKFSCIFLSVFLHETKSVIHFLATNILKANLP